MHKAPKFLVVFGDSDACNTFSTQEGLSGFLSLPKYSRRSRRVISLSKPDFSLSIEEDTHE